MEQEKVEKCLAATWNDITYDSRGNKLATIEVRFQTIEKAGEHNVRPLNTDRLELLPTYMVRCTSRIRVAGVLSEIESV